MKFLTTGEFAKMCGTQKGTLFFYDKEGLLKPKYVSSNGYRRYGMEQFYDFDMIVTLKEAGSSLKEIKSYLREKDKKKLLTLFEEKKRLLKEEQAKLTRRQRMLDELANSAREALAAVHDTLDIIEMEAEPLELVPVTPEDQATAESCVGILVEFSRRFESQGRYVMGPYGVVFTKENIDTSRYVADYFFCGADKDTPKADLHIKPRGRYAVLFHSGNLKSHTVAYARMIEMVKNSGLIIIGNMYAYDMASYFVSSGTDEYMTKFCVYVE